MNNPADRIRRQEAETLKAVDDKGNGVTETEFNKLDPRLCGPHCLAKDNGSGKWVSETHCMRCHDEAIMRMVDRPNHGTNYFAEAVDTALPDIVKDFTVNPIPETLHVGGVTYGPPERIGKKDMKWDVVPSGLRILQCVEAWPECESGMYDPRCCRFPKSCSCRSYDPAYTKPEELELPS